MTDQEINEKVARELGWAKTGLEDQFHQADCDICWRHPDGRHSGVFPPDYCHDIKAAWEVVEHLAKGYFGVSVSHDNLRELWQCAIESIKEPGKYETADTAPMAICLAFLKLTQGEK